MESIQFWDPLGDSITQERYAIEQQALKSKLSSLQTAPWKLRAYLIAGIVGCLMTIGFILFLFSIDPSIDFRIAYLLAIPGGILLTYYQSIMNVQENLLLLLLSERYHWAYEPEHDPERYDRLAEQYSFIFAQGHNQKLTDQIWGVADQQRHGLFWITSFQYIVGYGKSEHTYNKSIVAVKLEKPLPVNFIVEKNSFLQFDKNISTESHEFNHHFHIRCDFEDAVTKNKIMSVLSPSVLVRLVDLVNRYPIQLETIYFETNIIFFVGIGTLWKTNYTNFFKNVAIDNRDEAKFIESIQSVLEVPIEMVRFL